MTYMIKVFWVFFVENVCFAKSVSGNAAVHDVERRPTPVYIAVYT